MARKAPGALRSQRFSRLRRFVGPRGTRTAEMVPPRAGRMSIHGVRKRYNPSRTDSCRRRRSRRLRGVAEARGFRILRGDDEFLDVFREPRPHWHLLQNRLVLEELQQSFLAWLQPWIELRRIQQQAHDARVDVVEE